ncbi:uncharacterized protein [Lolium perenne]|uniref:uncharacterized protein n=1 Tax=Lolium perenne TaxID=4522 RepID=UPI003A9919CA
MQDAAAGTGDAPEQQEVVGDSDAPDQQKDAGDKEESILGNLSPISGDACTMDTEEYNHAMKESEDEEQAEAESAPPKEVFATIIGLEKGTDEETTPSDPMQAGPSDYETPQRMRFRIVQEFEEHLSAEELVEQAGIGAITHAEILNKPITPDDAADPEALEAPRMEMLGTARRIANTAMGMLEERSEAEKVMQNFLQREREAVDSLHKAKKLCEHWESMMGDAHKEADRIRWEAVTPPKINFATPTDQQPLTTPKDNMKKAAELLRAPAGASFEWIRTNFGECPEEADEDTRRTYARVYLWYMISRTLFADSGGKLAHWCWLKALTVLDNRWSWGTAALAYLYRQLDEACRRSGSGGIGGCMLLLSVWSWDRLSVGRPRVLNERPWPHYPHFPDREPTWAYLWDNVSEMSGDPKIMYMQYTAELDTLTAEQVEWEPYGSYYRIGASMTDLNHKCTEEARFWRMRCPLICMWLVEHHQPQRVMRQFGLYQECPPVWQDTDKALHRLDRQRQRKITNWPVHHSGHIAIVPHNLAAFNNYLEWFHENTRIELVKHAYPEEILDDPIQFDEVGQSQHDTFARRGRSTSIASELNFVRKEIEKTAEECEVIWEQSGTDDKPVGPLRYFIKNTARKMRRLASLLGCREAEIATSSSSEEREIPEDELILSQGILPKRTSKQAPRSAYQLKPRGKGPNRYTPEDYVNRGKKVVTEEDEGPRWRSALSRMRNDEPCNSP